jgi:hypothetical protein
VKIFKQTTMSSRRSDRLQTLETQEPVEDQQPSPVKGVRSNKKRKTLAADPEGGTGPKEKALNSVIGNVNEQPSQAQSSSSNDALSSLSLELLYMVLDNVSI